VTNPVVFLLTGAEAEGSTIPEAVPVENQAPETQGAAGGDPEPMEVASGEAPAMAGGGTRRRTARINSGSSCSFTENSGCGAKPLGANVWSRHE
jgi:hypothetical protein